MSRVDEIRERHLPGSSAGSGRCFECAVAPCSPEICEVAQVLGALDAAELEIARLEKAMAESVSGLEERAEHHGPPVCPECSRTIATVREALRTALEGRDGR